MFEVEEEEAVEVRGGLFGEPAVFMSFRLVYVSMNHSG
jgi:hypothetical protein